MIPVDLTAVLPTVIIGIIGWLIRGTFKTFGEKLDEVVDEVKGVRETVVVDGNRITALETTVDGWHPFRRKTDKPA